jgi:hypothetical protein
LAEYLVDDLQLAVFRTPLNLPRVEISQFWHERVHADRGHRWFRAVIYELFGASPGDGSIRAEKSDRLVHGRSTRPGGIFS